MQLMRFLSLKIFVSFFYRFTKFRLIICSVFLIFSYSISNVQTCTNLSTPKIVVEALGGDFACISLNKSFKISGYKNNPADTKYYVDFGDGKIDTLSHAELDTSGVETVSHKYLEVSCGNPNAVEDKYTFSLTAMRGCTTSTGVEIYKLTTVGPFYVGMPPKVNFTINSLDGELTDTISCVTEYVEFANTSEAGIDNFCETTATYRWDFGDGTKITFSTGEEGEVVQHLYESHGTYKVKLSIFHGCGTKTKTKTKAKTTKSENTRSHPYSYAT